ncbi:adenosylcobinamide-GDP ribazoletransferase [Reichenbachiella versicolor]|uniref:adenosylcobinamide-GDP ribazoletransferase n=1 Tax=Reichenbachiella versicolor TaxID=1821036 RepID=UPI001FED0B0F|nr:adenosylcobinamide-GDP ribazoletransferase [Reichenbachiella versicolor]
MKEINIFLTALMFYTRIPCYRWTGYRPDYINQSIRYFPLIGWIVGIISSIAYLLGTYLINTSFGVIASMIASILITGGFHEDGFADSCDGFGGGWTKEKILSIMKDSRVGAYGVIGLILLFLTKHSLMVKISTTFPNLTIGLVIISAHSLSRWIASINVFILDYVRDTVDSKTKPIAKQSGYINLIIGSLFGITPLIIFALFTDSFKHLITIPSLVLVNILLARYFKKWIGGYTGDCLGAAQQIVETSFLFILIVIWKFTL